jgi:hypothetical protein
MKKTTLLSFLLMLLFFTARSQIMATKLIGNNLSQSQLGWGVFAFYDFPLNGYENQSIRLELLDFGYYPYKGDPTLIPIGYLSIKVGYKYVFSETKTGFYIEPQAGYCRVISDDPDNLTTQTSYGDGVALAFEVGYSLEVGQRGHVFNFGLKYEHDIAGNPNTISSLGLRISYQFNLFKKRDDY